MSQDLGKSYSSMLSHCVEASLCQPDFPAPKMFMSGSMLPKAYKGLGLFRAASMSKGRKLQTKQEMQKGRKMRNT